MISDHAPLASSYHLMLHSPDLGRLGDRQSKYSESQLSVFLDPRLGPRFQAPYRGLPAGQGGLGKPKFNINGFALTNLWGHLQQGVNAAF